MSGPGRLCTPFWRHRCYVGNVRPRRVALTNPSVQIVYTSPPLIPYRRPYVLGGTSLMFLGGGRVFN